MAITYSSVDVRATIEHKRAVSRWIKASIDNENRKLGDIAIALCSDEYILKTNNEYLQHDYYTDIITFDYSEGNLLNGDLLISIDTVRSNATEYNVAPRAELMRVVIHGILHLCGYKDKTEEEAAVMRAKENFYIALYAE